MMCKTPHATVQGAPSVSVSRVGHGGEARVAHHLYTRVGPAPEQVSTFSLGSFGVL